MDGQADVFFLRLTHRGGLIRRWVPICSKALKHTGREKLQECHAEKHRSQRPSKHRPQAPLSVVCNNLLSTCQTLVSSGCWIPELDVITNLFSLINALGGKMESAGWYSKLSPFEVLSTLTSPSKYFQIPGRRPASDFTTTAETRAFSVSTDLQRPPHTTSLTKCLLYASCLVPRN